VEDWQWSLDKMLANPPDDPDSHFKCDQCGEVFLPGDRFYQLEGENLCYRCASSWLDDQSEYATEDKCYG
jgi:hypothetical protein